MEKLESGNLKIRLLKKKINSLMKLVLPNHQCSLDFFVRNRMQNYVLFFNYYEKSVVLIVFNFIYDRIWFL